MQLSEDLQVKAKKYIETQAKELYLECQAELHKKVQTEESLQSYRGGESGLSLRLEGKK